MESKNARYVLSIDAGQSRTSCLVGLSDGTLLSSGCSGAAAVPNAKKTERLMRAALTECVNQALTKITPQPKRVSAAYLSLTGGTSVALDILPKLIPVERIQAESDAVAALASGAFGGPGIALISGTGCVAFAQNAQGKRTVRGGWGYLLGDEGSGFWIGLQAVRAAIRADDGRSAPPSFIEQLMIELKVKDLRDAQSKIYNEIITRPDIARLAPMVMQAAERGDEIAEDIVNQAARELFQLVKATSEAADLKYPNEKIIVTAGGVMHVHTKVYKVFREIITKELPEYRLIVPRFPPVVGAFILGLRLLGIDINDEILARIENSLSRLQPEHLKA